mgnify:CR=1 FL=1
MNVLVEGIGSMVFGTQIPYYNELNWDIIGIDITNKSFGLYKVQKAYIVPKYSNCNCFNVIEKIIKDERIDVVFPTVNEGLIAWSQKKQEYYDKYGTIVMLSDEKIIKTCVDKWETYKFFCSNDIPTPKTSLEMKYDLLKPRIGRGSQGIYFKSDIKDKINTINSNDYISQDFIQGEEYTIDVLCDFDSKPVYIIPRKRLDIESGVSIKSVTVYDKIIIDYVKRIIEALKPIGIINIQCIKNENSVYFIEINPRIAGGVSLSFASSDNWFKAIECFIKGKQYIPKRIIYDNYMFRCYTDIVVHKKDLILE